MKKIIAIGAIAACGAAFAVESANIVGYAQSELNAGHTLATAQFLPVSGEGYSIQDVVLNAKDMYSVQLETLNSNGTSNKSFFWNDWDADTGFWDDGEGKATDVLGAGDALWIQAESGDNLQTAGQVPTSDVVVTLRSGHTAIGNAFPVAVSIQDIAVTGGDLYSVQLETLNPNGTSKKSFFWNDWDAAEGFWDDGEGGSITLNPGESLWVQGEAGQTLRIAAPEQLTSL